MVYNTKSCLDFAHARSVRNWLELLHTVLCLSIYLTTFLLNFLVHIVNHPRYQLACIASCYQSPRTVLPNPKVIQLRYPKLFKVFFLGTLVPSFCPRWTDLLLPHSYIILILCADAPRSASLHLLLFIWIHLRYATRYVRQHSRLDGESTVLFQFWILSPKSFLSIYVRDICLITSVVAMLQQQFNIFLFH